ncbi:DNA topoisomerase II [Boletus reticuloceps]|uniref:DNA topoisomerase 2 n=1 Tax=Boletus reticuloceps TaxID=495285 RepID=A0A8I2YJK3_9AGAM|nr:DNA topoisomerase II [Boletus reticuloceps]
MSSSEAEIFDLDNVSGTETDDYAPPAKKISQAKAPSKKTASKPVPKATKPAPKPKAAPKKKILSDKDDNASESASDVDEGAGDSDNENPYASCSFRGEWKEENSIGEIHKAVEHVLKRPDTYIGSVETIAQPMWTYDSDNKRMVHREVNYVPGFFKIVDEILVNAADHKVNDSNMDMLKVNIDVDEGIISVYNNGRGSNYDDTEKRLVGGRNGYGAKLANIYSHEFTIETADKNSGQKYKQTWTNHMGKCGAAKITKNGKGEGFTKITFRPDLKLFGMECIDDDTLSLLKRRVYDLAGTVRDVKVYLNDERLKVKNFKQYVEMYLESAAAEAAANSGGAAQAKPSVIYEQISPRWEVAFAVSEGSFQQVSFANSIATTKGGTHVALMADQIAKSLIAAIEKKNKAAKVKPCADQESYTKETLTLTVSKFGSKPVLSEEFMKKVLKSSIIDNVLNWARFKADQQIKKTDGSKRNRLAGMTKLADANNAGTRNADRCTLILTEGDSAKALAVAGLGVVGRDNFGVFPLRGKLLNVREAKHDQIMKNEEIQNIKKIMGLQHSKEYTNVSSLRYGRLMIMTDQDHDGSHIKGLLINFLDHFYPSLLKISNFLVEFVTPIVRVTKGKQQIDFFTIPEYEQWLERTADAHKWDSKYYKRATRKLIDLAFSKKKADDRKEWLRGFKDNVRSIPSVADGLKPGQRKVIWGCFKRKLKKEIKVAQLVGYISEVAAYHHGEASLTMTIVNLAQEYVGSNNLNLLLPNGQYGTRDMGGKDHASARYIFTELAPLTRTIFHPDDGPLLTQVIPVVLVNGADGWSTSIPCYNPVDIVANLRRLMAGEELVPMFPWWRGFKGAIRKVGEHKYDVVGVVSKVNDTTVEITELPIHKWTQSYKTELEVMIGEKGDGVIKDYKEHHDNVNIHFVITMAAKDLEKAEEQGLVEFFKLTSKINTSNMICFNLDGKIQKYSSPEEIVEEFYPQRLACYQKRKVRRGTFSMVLVADGNGGGCRITWLTSSSLQFEKLSNQARFVKMIIEKELVVSNRKKTDIMADLRKLKFRPFPKVAKAKAAGETEDVIMPDEDDEQAAEGVPGSTDYDYLLGMPIWSLTKEKVYFGGARGQGGELLALLERTPISLWNDDLDSFLKEWEKSCQDFDNKTLLDASGKKIKKKQATLKHRKSLTGRNDFGLDHSEDEFKPAKAAVKKKPKPAVAGPSKQESDDEKPAPAPKKAPVKKAPAKVKSEAESDFSDIPVKKKAAAKKPIKVDSDSDIELPAVQAKGKGKGKAKSEEASKRKSPADEDESDDEAYIRPAMKKTKTTQAAVTDFFGKAGPVEATKKAAARKAFGKQTCGCEEAYVEEEDTRTAAPTRAARGQTKKYIEIESDSDEDMNL